jgi:hypothetical protein
VGAGVEDGTVEGTSGARQPDPPAHRETAGEPIS